MEKYKQVERWIIQELQDKDYQVGQRFYSEAEIAHATGVSRQTVRQAIGNLEHMGLLRSRRGSGTYVAKKTIQARTHQNVGVISTYSSDYIFPHIISGIQETLSAHGYSMQLFITNNHPVKEAEALAQMMEQVDALIVEPAHSALPNPNKLLYEQIKARKIPLVFFNARYPRAGFPTVAMDDAVAGYAATGLLLREGHTAIAGLFKSDDRQGHLRCEGYMQAMQKAGLPIRAEYIQWYNSKEFLSLFEGEGLAESLRACTAIFCYNDELALHVISYLKGHGKRIPEDISVIGIDNADIASICDPPLTTIDHPKKQLGITAANSVLTWLEQGKEPRSILFDAKLVSRKSTRKR